MKSSFQSLIPFLPFLLNSPQQLTQINSSSTELSQLLITTLSNDLLWPLIIYRHGPRRKHSLCIVEKACLLIHCLAMDVLLLRAYASAEMCLPSRCLAMGLYIKIFCGTPLLHCSQKPAACAYLSQMNPVHTIPSYL
jgi:hypothetical protein